MNQSKLSFLCLVLLALPALAQVRQQRCPAPQEQPPVSYRSDLLTQQSPKPIKVRVRYTRDDYRVLESTIDGETFVSAKLDVEDMYDAWLKLMSMQNKTKLRYVRYQDNAWFLAPKANDATEDSSNVGGKNACRF